MKTLRFLLCALLFLSAAGAGRAADTTEPSAPENEPGMVRDNLDLYPAEVLAGKGMLYAAPPFEPKQEIEVRYTYGSEHPVYINPKVLYAPEHGLGVYSLRVLKVEDEGYLISTTYDAVAKNQRRTSDKQVMLPKKEARRMGLTYIDLLTLHRFMSEHPEYVRSVLGASLSEDEPLPSGKGPRTRISRRLLRVSPKDDAEFVKIEMPQAAPPFEIVVLEKRDGWFRWFRLQTHFRFIYNASANPNVCARSLFDRTFKGWWKIPYDPNGYPLLFPAMLNREGFARLAE